MSMGGYLRGVIFRSGPMYEEYKARCAENERRSGTRSLEEAYSDSQKRVRKIEANLSSPSLHDNSKVVLFFNERTRAFINTLKSQVGQLSPSHVKDVNVFAMAHADYMYRLSKARGDIQTFNGFIQQALEMIADNKIIEDKDKKRVVAYRHFAHYASEIISRNAKDHDADLADFLQRRIEELLAHATFDEETGRLLSVNNCPSAYEPERMAPKLGYWVDGSEYDANQHKVSNPIADDFGKFSRNLEMLNNSI